MKTSKTFRLSEEAINIINQQENQSKYIEDLILSKPTQAAPSSTDLLSIESMLDIRFAALLDVLDKKLDKLNTIENLELGPTPEPVKFACCLNEKKPCKHWTWDGVKQSYTNTLTGEVREIYI